MDVEGRNFESRIITLICGSRIHSTTVRSTHRVYVSVLYGSENKQRLFPYTALTGCFL